MHVRCAALGLTTLLLVGACAEFGEAGSGGVSGEERSDGLQPLTASCATNLNTFTTLLPWRLGVSTLPDPPEGGEEFAASLTAVAVYREAFLDSAQDLVAGGVTEVNVLDAQITVHVRSGAQGEDVVLELDPFPYVCTLSPRNVCDPADDLPNGGNTRCSGMSELNPCARFIRLPTSEDCGPGGICEERGKTGLESQCERNGFCVTGDLEIGFSAPLARYIADPEGEILFGWAEADTGATIQPSGDNQGAWEWQTAPVFAQPSGANGTRLLVGTIGIAIECTMGVDCRGELGPTPRCVETSTQSRTPDSALVSIPIEP